jgi:zinc/manganese transport system permease protein
VLFLAIFTTRSSAGTGTAAVRVLFGSIFGLSGSDASIAAGVSIVAIAATLVAARPLLFASLDPDVAAAQGVPVRLLGLGFLAVLGVVAAESTQAVGALLLLGLVAAPAAAAHRLARNPYAGLALSAAFAVGAVWLGLALSYVEASVPPSTAIISVATVLFVLAAGAGRIAAALPRRAQRATPR